MPLLRDAKHNAVLLLALTDRMPVLPAGLTDLQAARLRSQYETVGDWMVEDCANELARPASLPQAYGGVYHRGLGPVISFISANETLALLCDALRSARVIPGFDDDCPSNQRYADGFEVMLGALEAEGRHAEAEAWFTEVRSRTLQLR